MRRHLYPLKDAAKPSWLLRPPPPLLVLVLVLLVIVLVLVLVLVLLCEAQDYKPPQKQRK